METIDRTRYIGGTDAGAIARVNPYRGPMDVWLSKTNRYTPVVSNDAVYWGSKLEAVVADEYSIRREVTVRRRPNDGWVSHPDFDFIGGHIDRDVPNSEGILECKTSNDREAWEGGVPQAIQMQVQHYLACLPGKAWVDVAVLLHGRDFRIHRLERDDDLIDVLIQAEVKFWTDYVVKDQEPPVDYSDPNLRDALVRVFPEVTSEILDFPEDEAEAFPEWDDLCIKIYEHRGDMKEWEARKKEIENRWLHYMGNAGVLRLPDGSHLKRSVVAEQKVSFTRKPYVRLYHSTKFGGKKS